MSYSMELQGGVNTHERVDTTTLHCKQTSITLPYTPCTCYFSMAFLGSDSENLNLQNGVNFCVPT